MILPLLAALLLAQSDGVPASQELHTTATKLDTAFFDAYNRCQAEKFEALLDPAVEFYHDKSGRTQGAAPLMDALKKNICGKVRRTLVSMKVYPMDGIGLLQTGVHRFCEIQKDGSCPTTGEAQFTHIWKKDGDAWRLVHVLSYDHQPYRPR